MFFSTLSAALAIATTGTNAAAPTEVMLEPLSSEPTQAAVYAPEPVGSVPGDKTVNLATSAASSPTPVDLPPLAPTSRPELTSSVATETSASLGPADQIVVKGQVGDKQNDPAQAVNEVSYQAVQKVDGAIVAPLAVGYKKVLPSPARAGLRNFLINLTEPIVFVNFMLQGKPGKAMETLGRFATNSTLGIGGLVDLAKKEPFNLPYRKNGFANTMGFYGIGPGPYLFVPLVGPTTVRDLLGLGLDRAMLPAAIGAPLSDPSYTLASGTIKALDDRVELDCELRAHAQTSNPYNTAREYYLERRKSDIEALHGRTYVSQGRSLAEVIQQCAAGQQRAVTPIAIPADQLSEDRVEGVPLVIPMPVESSPPVGSETLVPEPSEVPKMTPPAS